ncbi:YPL034W-like protein [Saccharomyces cerevisiae FostersB]|nr:YPL034W-like protein [Saccharomyces cerevisiae FostersB]
MTTRKTVDSRLLEWQTTCKHPVINLTPEKVDKLYHLKLKSESKNISSNRLLPISLSSLQKKKWRNFSSKIIVTHTSLPFQILRCQPFALIKMVDFSLAEKVQ